jgi:hypothetical protein
MGNIRVQDRSGLADLSYNISELNLTSFGVSPIAGD